LLHRLPPRTGTVEERWWRTPAVIPTGGVQTIVQNGVYLTGDAAALSNPITNEV
jgi:flavin-dependent dehydrogenase